MSSEAASLLSFFDRPSAPVAPVLERLPFGAVRPQGWIRAYMREDLANGTTGRLDRLVPDIFADDVFGAARRTRLRDSGATGSQLNWEDPSGLVETKWWNAETQANWWDGYLRNVALVGDAEQIARAEVLVGRLLATQDADGYLGIYGTDLRFRHTGENGELWAQAMLFRALLGWGEARGDERVLAAVLRALDHAIGRINAAGRNPFAVENPWGGVGHGLMFTDACEIAARITGRAEYLAFAARLYRWFSEAPGINDDIGYAQLCDAEKPFLKHAAHTYEHLRTLLAAWRATGHGELGEAWRAALRKLERCVLPSGAGIGFESIEGRVADAATTGAEVCAMAELRHSFAAAALSLGDGTLADRAEEVLFNAVHGARTADARALAYCMTDTCRRADCRDPRNGEENRRYKFSPAHQDVAVCCAPNAGRVHPWHVADMWARSSDGLAVVLYGPCSVRTEWQGVRVEAEVETLYPYGDEVKIRVRTERPTRFTLSLRVPSWSGSAEIDAGGAVVRRAPGWAHVERAWSDEVVTVRFSWRVETRPAADGSVSVRRGPLVFALPLAGTVEETRGYGEGFKDRLFVPCAGTAWDYRLAHDVEGWRVARGEVDEKRAWAKPAWTLRGRLRLGEGGAVEDVSLVPMGSVTLRQVTFGAAG